MRNYGTDSPVPVDYSMEESTLGKSAMCRCVIVAATPELRGLRWGTPPNTQHVVSYDGDKLSAPQLRPRASTRASATVPEISPESSSTCNFASKGTVAPKVKVEGGTYKHVLLTILDANPCLCEGSKQALAAAVQLARQSPTGKVTTLVIDEPGTTCAEPSKRLETIDWHFSDKGFSDFIIMEKDITSPASVLIGDLADEINAELVLISSEAVHKKHVDANLLCEMVSCPVMLLPW
eukprot:gene3736-13793_t